SCVGPVSFVSPSGTVGGAEGLGCMLRHFGQDDCAVMDFGGWQGPLTVGDEEVTPAEFVPLERHDDTIEAGELAERHDQLVVVDARLRERWRGEPNPI